MTHSQVLEFKPGLWKFCSPHLTSYRFRSRCLSQMKIRTLKFTPSPECNWGMFNASHRGELVAQHNTARLMKVSSSCSRSFTFFSLHIMRTRVQRHQRSCKVRTVPLQLCWTWGPSTKNLNHTFDFALLPIKASSSCESATQQTWASKFDKF